MAEEQAGQRQQAAIHAHFWGNQINIVPQNWKFPRKMKANEMIRNYFIGDVNQGIPPYGVLVSGHIRHTKWGSHNLSNMQKFMARVKELGRAKGVWVENERTWTLMSCTILYDAIKEDLILPATEGVGQQRRQDDMSWRTLVDLIRQSAKWAKECAQQIGQDDGNDEQSGD